jgi:predicted HTH transcriptional regulator
LFNEFRTEEQIAADNVSSEDVLKLLDYPSYFELLDIDLPSNKDSILDRLAADNMIVSADSGNWNITNLGAILFARNLSSFTHLKRKAVRLILYRENSRIETIREIGGAKGYACGFGGLIDYISNLLPANEVVGKALRKSVPMYPELAIRELVANALIHQDFFITGTGPMIEIFDERMEITNPGIPLVETDRFLDSPPRSRNESLASFMRRIGFCEERGSGVDKVVFQTEVYQLPAPSFEVSDMHTKAVLFAQRPLTKMSKTDRIRACYLHSCLRYVNRDYMTNASLRERFGIEPKNSATASRIIRDSVDAKLIKLYDPGQSRKYAKYVPFWS